ncbi:hypothetical protein M5D96_013608, partial [Drosophila gunungcola]
MKCHCPKETNTKNLDSLKSMFPLSSSSSWRCKLAMASMP